MVFSGNVKQLESLLLPNEGHDTCDHDDKHQIQAFWKFCRGLGLCTNFSEIPMCQSTVSKDQENPNSLQVYPSIVHQCIFVAEGGVCIPCSWCNDPSWVCWKYQSQFHRSSNLCLGKSTSASSAKCGRKRFLTSVRSLAFERVLMFFLIEVSCLLLWV